MRFSQLVIVIGVAISASLGCSLAFAGAAPETPPSIWNPGSWGVSANTEYFTSKANYDEERGSFTKLPNGNEIRAFENTLRARYAFGNLLSVYGGTGFTQTTVLDTTVEKTNAGLTQAFAGANFQIVRRWWRLVPEIEVGFPLDATDPNQTVPLTGDGVSYARAGVFLFKPFKRIRFESYLGFHAPGEQLAKRVIYAFSGEFVFVTGFTLGGGIAGYESVLADGMTRAQRIRTTNLAMAGGQRYWAYDPSSMEGKVWLGFRADRAFNFRVGYAKTINGMRSAEGQSILLSVAFNAPGDRVAGRKARSRAYDPEVSMSDVEVEEEPVDPELFEQENEPRKTRPRSNKKTEALDDAERILEGN